MRKGNIEEEKSTVAAKNKFASWFMDGRGCEWKGGDGITVLKYLWMQEIFEIELNSVEKNCILVMDRTRGYEL